jgi:hypothetical protein
MRDTRRPRLFIYVLFEHCSFSAIDSHVLPPLRSTVYYTLALFFLIVIFVGLNAVIYCVLSIWLILSVGQLLTFFS